MNGRALLMPKIWSLDRLLTPRHLKNLSILSIAHTILQMLMLLRIPLKQSVLLPHVAQQRDDS